MKLRVLHIGEADKFTLPMWKVVSEHIGLDGHVFLFRKANFPPPFPDGFVTGSPLAWTRKFIALAHRAERIVVHGLFDPRVFVLLFVQPWLLRKCYWIIWGGDLYTTLTDAPTLKLRLREAFKRRIIRRMGFLVTYVRGDVSLARSLYQAGGQHIECLMYSSNIVDLDKMPLAPPNARIKVMVGNSADDSNKHTEIFARLRAIDDGSFDIVCPLSYGDAAYGDQVAAEGAALFGERFTALRQMMPYDQYLEVLAGVDVAVFAHKRQQAMGVSVALLAMGKKLVIRADVPQWETFAALGVQVEAFDGFDLAPLSQAAARSNRQRVADYFALPRLVSQLRTLFGD